KVLPAASPCCCAALGKKRTSDSAEVLRVARGVADANSPRGEAKPPGRRRCEDDLHRRGRFANPAAAFVRRRVGSESSQTSQCITRANQANINTINGVWPYCRAFARADVNASDRCNPARLGTP